MPVVAIDFPLSVKTYEKHAHNSLSISVKLHSPLTRLRRRLAPAEITMERAAAEAVADAAVLEGVFPFNLIARTRKDHLCL